MIRALIFDFDGTILDTELPGFLGWQKTYAEHGQTLLLQEYLLVVGSDFSVFDPRRTLEERLSRKLDWGPIDAQRHAFDYKMIEESNALPGVRELLAEATEKNIPCAIASSSPIDWVDRHLKRLGLLHHFSFVSCAGNGVSPKPAPTVYLQALKSLGVAPHETIAIEDSLNGFRAARCAEIPCVIVPNQITKHLAFSPEHELLSSLHNITLDHLPRYAVGRA